MPPPLDRGLLATALIMSRMTFSFSPAGDRVQVTMCRRGALGTVFAMHGSSKHGRGLMPLCKRTQWPSLGR